MMWSWGLLLCALVACLIHSFFIRRMGLVTQEFDKKSPPKDFHGENSAGVSVIVCAKNEAARLDALIPKILDQNYPEFELLVVDDHSQDNTSEILDFWQKKDSRLRYVPFTAAGTELAGKKAALSLGISRASHEILLLTDADCTPSSDQWITQMTAPLKGHKTVVLGYGGYQKKPGLLNALIRFETTLTAGLYLGQAMAGQPYMGVGRNLAYRKDFFLAQNGFKSHEHLASGDDDLLINHGAHATNTSVVIDPHAYTWSEPKDSWRSLFRQKRRHLTTAHFYRNATKLFLGLYSGSIILFYLCALLLVFMTPFDVLVYAPLFTLIFLRSAFLIAGLQPIFKKFQTTDLRFWIPLLEPLLICLQLIIFVSNRLSKPTHWN